MAQGAEVGVMDWRSAEEQAEKPEEERRVNEVEQDVRLAVAAVRTIEHWSKDLLDCFEEGEDVADGFTLNRSELERIIHNSRFAAKVLAGFSTAGETLLMPLGSLETRTM